MKRWMKQGMRISAAVLGLGAFGFLAGPAVQAGGARHWGYEGAEGPGHWAKLDPKYAVCGTGMRQSPIDLPAAAMGGASELTVAYKAGTGEAINNGHTIQVNVAPGSGITVGGKTFALLQFHFHTPSENTIAGKHAPMEMHLVHKAADGQLAVVAVMIVEGAGGSPIEGLPLPGQKGGKAAVSGGIDPAALLPADRAFYAFSGSLTTPPCSERVAWHVMVHPVRVSRATIAAMHTVMGKNNRPVAPVNARRMTVNN